MELSLQNISVSLSGKEILKSISLTVEEGIFVSLLGASGCGKSTLLKTIAGIIPQTRGSVILDGKSADKLPCHKRGTVIVFQDFRLFPHMTVVENISFPLKMRGVSKEEYLKIASELLEKVQLTGFENRRSYEMSGGQIQRVALARALAAKPNVLLLDEPFSSLDVNLRKEMRSLVLKLQKEFKITTVLVTHDRHEALTMSDKVALMMDGKILQYDTPEKIFESPVSRQVADYFGDVIYIDGIVKDHIFQSEIISFSVDKPDGLYEVMFRPSAVQIMSNGNKNFRICDLSYQGENYSARLEHNETKIKLNTTIPFPSPYQIGDVVTVLFDTNRSVLFPV
ncbi:ABC transporter ATP-binding protein [Serpentinicella alkaliphila]|uniref:ABC-type quaternary amine transporter n=1 Tax=Serpentinicella alkaliphila TaxID=1734049 RepID=A0A4R2TG74_9FIRM|nr:ABC transporter ATP-binding protein [Serpentinicella alkaliphila]QUH24595.1 ABC transporter ATP-binding protein [Serpentinicella alkaliphila]TCQ02590.1 putative spermidine/putrescine transport system ATP-binding protein [Serpentinicella alkaliphila]